MGADLEFADELTLGSALSGRRILSGTPSQSPHSGGMLRPEHVDTPSPPPATERSETEQTGGVSVPHGP